MNEDGWRPFSKNTKFSDYPKCYDNRRKSPNLHHVSKSKAHTTSMFITHKWWRWPFMNISRHEKEMRFLEMQNFELRGAIRSAMDENRKLKMQIEQLGKQS